MDFSTLLLFCRLHDVRLDYFWEKRVRRFFKPDVRVKYAGLKSANIEKYGEYKQEWSFKSVVSGSAMPDHNSRD
jgi:hypothetical protein